MDEVLNICGSLIIEGYIAGEKTKPYYIKLYNLLFPKKEKIYYALTEIIVVMINDKY